MRVCSCHGEPYGGSLKTKIELPYDSVIPLLAKDQFLCLLLHPFTLLNYLWSLTLDLILKLLFDLVN